MLHYLDNSATTRVSAASAEKALEMMTENFANPSSLYSLGVKAEAELERARHIIARALNAGDDELFFTSGGTEANNLAVFGTAEWLKRRGNKIVTTAVEHSSVYEAARTLSDAGFEVVFVKPGSDGNFSEESFSREIDKNTILVSAMYVNNETGAILPVDRLKGIIERNGSPALLHCDCVQAFCKLPLRLKKIGVDLASVSGHKLHAPKGVGALYVRKGLHIKPLHYGGEQEKRLRPGTEALPLIAAFGEAVREADPAKNYETVSALNAYLRGRLSKLEGIKINSPENALPYILNFTVPGIRSETMLRFLAGKEVYVSSGSACAKGKPSHVLSAMGMKKDDADSAIRVSFCETNTKDDIDALIEGISEGQRTLIKK